MTKTFEQYLAEVIAAAAALAADKNRGLNALPDDAAVKKIVSFAYTEEHDPASPAAELVEMFSYHIHSPEELEIIRLDAQYPAVKEYYEQYDAALLALEAKHGIGHHFQSPNPDDPAVFETYKPEYKTIKMESFAVKRTSRPGERGSGSNLSLKRATELGYENFKIAGASED